MMLRPLLALLLLVSPALAQQAPPLTPEQATLKAHVQFLASDALRGREAGTRDYDVAAEYVAAQMLAIGLQPAGDKGGWFQPFDLATYRATEKAGWTLQQQGKDVPLVNGTDFVDTAADRAGAFRAEGGMVFAGYGIVNPETGRDDFRGLDVRGKIVLLVSGHPKGLPSDVAAHFSDERNKVQIAYAHGAAAVVFVATPALTRQLPFEKLKAYHGKPHQTWSVPQDGETVTSTPGILGIFSEAGAQKLFAGGRIRWADVVAAEARGTRLPSGPLAGMLTVSARSSRTLLHTRNVVGMIPGTDPVLGKQYVVLSAHLDHVGVGEAVNGDTIYNGAMDNAIGTAMVLEIARALQQDGKRPRRSVLIIALSAEEEGLFGSDYFAHFPTVPKGSIVADVNLDMPILTYPLVDLVVLGGERSSIGPVVAAAAKAEGLGVVPDPEPEEMFFVRSDHYSFVQAGIPAVSIDTGPGGTGAVVARKFLDENYHKPSDQIDLPFDWNSAVKYKHVGLATVQALADGDARPSWNQGDFFGTLFGGAGRR